MTLSGHARSKSGDIKMITIKKTMFTKKTMLKNKTLKNCFISDGICNIQFTNILLNNYLMW
jgi:hypothetical protein